MISRRRALREEYSRVFSDINGARNFQRDGDEVDNCWLSAVLVDPVTAGWHVDDLRAALDAYNIESRPLWKPMHQQRVFAGAGSFLTGAAEQLLATGLTPSAPVQADSSPRRSSGRIGPGPHRAVVVPDSHATYRATAAISAIRLCWRSRAARFPRLCRGRRCAGSRPAPRTATGLHRSIGRRRTGLPGRGRQRRQCRSRL